MLREAGEWKKSRGKGISIESLKLSFKSKQTHLAQPQRKLPVSLIGTRLKFSAHFSTSKPLKSQSVLT